MFTGIVTELGRVTAVTEADGGRRIVIAAPKTAAGMTIGDSIAVNGVCLTAVTVDHGGRVEVDVVAETLERSNLGDLAPGDTVDLERPMATDGRFDGHFVQGHVDGVGRIEQLAEEGDARRLRVAIPSALARYVVEKGSITIDGASLTVTAVAPDGATPWCEIVLIPHTLEVTVLGRKGVGDTVNIEVDVIAKYVERLMGAAT